MSTPVNKHAEHMSPFRYSQVGNIIIWLLSPILELLKQIISLQYSKQSSHAISLFLATSTCRPIKMVVVREHFKHRMCPSRSKFCIQNLASSEFIQPTQTIRDDMRARYVSRIISLKLTANEYSAAVSW
jgi:hypothetical protein